MILSGLICIAFAGVCLAILFGLEYCCHHAACRPAPPAALPPSPIPAIPAPWEIPTGHSLVVLATANIQAGCHARLTRTPDGLRVSRWPDLPEQLAADPIAAPAADAAADPSASPSAYGHDISCPSPSCLLELTDDQRLSMTHLTAYAMLHPGAQILAVMTPHPHGARAARLLSCHALPAPVYAQVRDLLAAQLPAPAPAPRPPAVFSALDTANNRITVGEAVP